MHCAYYYRCKNIKSHALRFVIPVPVDSIFLFQKIIHLIKQNLDRLTSKINELNKNLANLINNVQTVSISRNVNNYICVYETNSQSASMRQTHSLRL